MLAAAPCTAMVFVWSNLTDGEPNFTLDQVALNDTIMVFAFAPIVGLLLGLSSITVPWETLFLSVVLYIVVPVVAAQLWRRSLLASGGEPALAGTLRRLQPVSLVAFLATLVLLFGFQGEQIIRQPLVIVLLAVPIVIQVYLNAGIAYALNRALGVPHNVACPSALIGASNFFELAVAAAIALFGFQSGAALATVVGVLVEVPVMLSVVRIVLRTRGWYERAAATQGHDKDIASLASVAEDNSQRPQWGAQLNGLPSAHLDHMGCYSSFVQSPIPHAPCRGLPSLPNCPVSARDVPVMLFVVGIGAP